MINHKKMSAVILWVSLMLMVLVVPSGHAQDKQAATLQIVEAEKALGDSLDGAVNDHKPLDPSPELRMELVGFGCVTGFGGWIEPAFDEKAEIDCDKNNLKVFQTLLNECGKPTPESQISLFDIDHDGCVTCKDYFAWKKSIKNLYDKEKRSTSGEALHVAQCVNE